MKLPALLHTSFLVLLHLQWRATAELRPVINGGQSLCQPLRSKEATLKSEGLVCFRLHAEDAEHLDVEVFIADEEWELEDVFWGVGSNATDVPSNALSKIDFESLPLVNRSIGKREIVLKPSLEKEAEFSCPQESAEKYAALKVIIRSRLEHSKQRALTFLDDASSESASLTPFDLSCKDFSVAQIQAPQNRIAHVNSKATSTHRHLRSPSRSMCPTYPSSTRFNLTETNMTYIQHAADLMITLSFDISGKITKLINEQRAFYERFDGWWDLNDQALVAKTYGDGVCYAMIMGTVGFNILDQIQNLLLFPTKIKGSDCVAREGFRDAYNTSYREDFRRTVESCVNSCPGGTCPLVVGGHSQGGAAAMIMSIDLRHYNPTTITFGSPRPFMIDQKNPCDDFLADRHYRLVNTEDGGYDSVAYGTTSGSESLGELLLLDDVNWPIAGPGNDNQREPRLSDAHRQSLYLDRINNMVSRDCFPVPVGVWPAGHVCTQDDECEGSCASGLCSG